jgi:hypothetical protein
VMVYWVLCKIGEPGILGVGIKHTILEDNHGSYRK